MSKKEKCKELMTQLFGTASAIIVDTMDEDTCQDLCRKKVKAFLGEEKAILFDNM